MPELKQYGAKAQAQLPVDTSPKLSDDKKYTNPREHLFYTGQKGTNAIFVMTHAEIFLIPTEQKITYARVVLNFCPQKADPHFIRITAGGNLINYPGKLTTQTADLTTSKLIWKMSKAPRVLSTCASTSKIST